MFNEATSDGEIVNCVKRLRSSYVNGQLFSSSSVRSGWSEPKSFSNSYDAAEIARLEDIVKGLSSRNHELWVDATAYRLKYNDEMKRANQLDGEVLKLRQSVKESEDCYIKAFIVGMFVGAILIAVIFTLAQNN